MSYSVLNEYIKGVVEAMDNTIFYSGRKEVLHEFNGLPEINTATLAWLLPLTSTASFEQFNKFSEIANVNMIFYRHDYLGSEIDQNDLDSISDENKTLNDTHDVARQFIRLFDFNDISPDASEYADLLEIGSINFDNVIKDNDYLLTGTLLSLTVGLPDKYDYCSDDPETGFDFGIISNFRWSIYTLEYVPSTVTNVVGGNVRQYDRNGETVYRFEPSPYDYTLDAYYRNFDGTNVSDLIVTRS